MKKFRNILLSLILVAVMFTATGCFGGNDNGNGQTSPESTPTVEKVQDPYIVDTVDKSTALYLVQSAYFKLRTSNNVRDRVRVTREYEGKTEENFIFYDDDETRWGWVTYSHYWSYNSIYSETEYQYLSTKLYNYSTSKKTTYSDNSVENKENISENQYSYNFDEGLIYNLCSSFYDIDKVTVDEVNSAVLLSNGNIILSRKDRPYSFNESNKTQTIFYMDYEINSKGQFVSITISDSVEQFDSKADAEQNEYGDSLGGYSSVFKFEYNIEIPAHIKSMYTASKAKYEEFRAS